MTTQKLFKRRVRERMSKTGESYTAARRHVVSRRDAVTDVPRPDLSAALELASDEKVREATGQGWDAWISILDQWGAGERNHREIVAFLHAEHEVPPWWTQAITNGYERVRGLRAKHQQADGFTIYASKTIGVPLDALFGAFVDERTRSQWLTDGPMSLRTSQPGKLARFDWGDGGTRILVTFDAKGPMKSTAHVSHERLPDVAAGNEAKASWKSRLGALKSFLEATDV